MVLRQAADRRDQSAKRGSRNRLEKFESADKVSQSVNKNVSQSFKLSKSGQYRQPAYTTWKPLELLMTTPGTGGQSIPNENGQISNIQWFGIGGLPTQMSHL